MANLLILNGARPPRDAAFIRYRGTDRTHPTYCDAAPRDHEVNQLFMWYLEEGGELGVVHNLTKAKRYCELCNIYFPYRHFELIEVTDGDVSATSGDTFRGFDISNGYNNSLLWWEFSEPAEIANNVSEEIAVLVRVVHSFFAPRLNQYGLFQSFEDASLCRRAMIALQYFSPGLYEGGDLSEFEVVGLYSFSLR